MAKFTLETKPLGENNCVLDICIEGEDTANAGEYDVLSYLDYCIGLYQSRFTKTIPLAAVPSDADLEVLGRLFGTPKEEPDPALPPSGDTAPITESDPGATGATLPEPNAANQPPVDQSQRNPIMEDDLETLSSISGFSFSGLPVDAALEQSSNITLATIVGDRSGSIGGYEADLEKAIGISVEALKKSPYAEALLVRVVKFDHEIDEVHGFKALDTVSAADYNGAFSARGSTLLFDATLAAIEAAKTYGEKLKASEAFVNGIVIVITDGGDTGSRIGDPAKIKDLLAQIRKEEKLNSFKLILVGIGNKQYIDPLLTKFAQEAGIDQYVGIGDATPQKLARLADFVSKSVSSSSQAIMTGGGPSQNVTSITF